MTLHEFNKTTCSSRVFILRKKCLTIHFPPVSRTKNHQQPSSYFCAFCFAFKWKLSPGKCLWFMIFTLSSWSCLVPTSQQLHPITGKAHEGEHKRGENSVNLSQKQQNRATLWALVSRFPLNPMRSFTAHAEHELTLTVIHCAEVYVFSELSMAWLKK